MAEKHRHGEPLEENWILRAGSEDFSRLVDYRDEYQPGARRFDVGERTNFELTPMAIAAGGPARSAHARRAPSGLGPRSRAPGAREANCFAAIRGASLRIAPHLHTTDEDVRKLVGALAHSVP